MAWHGTTSPAHRDCRVSIGRTPFLAWLRRTTGDPWESSAQSTAWHAHPPARQGVARPAKLSIATTAAGRHSRRSHCEMMHRTVSSH